MFLNTVPIEQHESVKFVHDFPRANRDGVMQTWDDVKRQLGRAGGQGFTYVDVLSDFHLLLFLTAFLDMVSASTERGAEERGRGHGGMAVLWAELFSVGLVVFDNLFWSAVPRRRPSVVSA